MRFAKSIALTNKTIKVIQFRVKHFLCFRESAVVTSRGLVTVGFVGEHAKLWAIAGQFANSHPIGEGDAVALGGEEAHRWAIAGQFKDFHPIGDPLEQKG